MVGPQGRVVGVEHIPELVAWSIKNVEKSAAAPLLKEGSLLLHVGGMVLQHFHIVCSGDTRRSEVVFIDGWLILFLFQSDMLPPWDFSRVC